MAIKYVVVHPFHGYEKGQEITDPDEIADVIADNEAHVVRVYVPDTVLSVGQLGAPPPASDKQ